METVQEVMAQTGLKKSRASELLKEFKGRAR
jgi:hypothetical protein